VQRLSWQRFWQELSGAFGDPGTFLPLVVAALTVVGMAPYARARSLKVYSPSAWIALYLLELRARFTGEAIPPCPTLP
jgi:hypothetical protein